MVSFSSQPSKCDLTPILEAIYRLGLNLEDAPEIDEEKFVGRNNELSILEETLLPQPERLEQKISIISGLGGMGKTQLAIAFAKRNQRNFSAIFWLNAKSGSSLRRSILAVAPRLSLPSPQAGVTGGKEEGEVVEQFKSWQSRQENMRWMLIFDNYDHPELPGRKSTGGYSIK